MKITKHGKQYKEASSATEEFKCSKCGCEFKAKDDEYYTDEEISSFSTSTSCVISSTYTSTVTDRLVCSCPECHKIVTKNKDRTVSKPYVTWSSSVNGSSTPLGGTTEILDNAAFTVDM